MATQKEIPMEDDELDALMAELESETADLVATPAAVVAKAPEPEPEPNVEDELAALDAELAAAGDPDTAPAPAPAPKPAPAPEPEPIVSAEDEMAALEAELADAPAAPAPPPKPEPVPEPVATPAPTLKVVPPAPPATEPDPMPEPNPLPKDKPAGLQFFIDVAAFRDETKVAEHNLDNCMMQQAGLRAFYGEQAARAEAQHSRLKVRFDVLEAQLYDQHRKALIATGEKVTEKAVENAVKLDPKWLKNKNVVIEAETIAAVNKSLVESLKDRRDMIIQLGADRREEGKGAVRIMAQEQTHADLKERARAAAAR